MNLNFNFPDLVPDPSYSFTATGTRLPVLQQSLTKDGHIQGIKTQGAGDSLYDQQLRRALAGEEEDLPEQEERVYRAEGNIRNFGYNFLLPPGRRQTQAETEHAGSRSPTPSDGRPVYHRQEDNQLGDQSEMPTIAADDDGNGDDDVDREERDLDDEMEDRDASYGSGEGGDSLE
ncbi:hypothetical protein QFC19_008912 [Naganishia cerealis]|uniref:Uncharacterized protein n=1 Tax=Naganishia cerealis TaxID=610337 RepID=A0ACC2UZI5_9TREE|nr:hypothetical protein QFC19_008912 [Naganishia cerealis]